MIRLKPSLPAVLLATSVVVSVALAGLVWRVFHEQTNLDRRRTAEQVDAAADAMAARLRGGFAETGDTLSAWLSDPTAAPPTVQAALSWSPCATAVPHFIPTRDCHTCPRSWRPRSRSLCSKRLSVSKTPRGNRPPPRLTTDSSSRIGSRRSAPARSRVSGAHCARRANSDEAAAAYDRLVALGDVRADGLPASLYGLDGQRLVHRARGDSSAERQVAERIVNGLDNGQWAVTRGMAEFYGSSFSRRQTAAVALGRRGH